MSHYIKLVKARALSVGDVLLISRSCFNGCTAAEIIREVNIQDTRDTGEVYVKTDYGAYNLYDDTLIPVAADTAEHNGEVLRNMGTHRCPYCTVGTRTYLINDEKKHIISLCDHPHCGKISAALIDAARNGKLP
jgi:hypothetical protein